MPRDLGTLSRSLDILLCTALHTTDVTDGGVDAPSDGDEADREALDGADESVDLAGDPSEFEPYLSNCNSLFAARILQRELEETGEEAGDCEVPLRRDIGLGNALLFCNTGESPNACRQRYYEHPPSPDLLAPGCAGDSVPDGCLRASWLPRCADGTDECDEDEVVCVDGTRPMVWAEAATRAPSNRWIVFMGGEGGPCTGVNCWLDYRYGQLLINAATPRAMSTLHPDHPIAGSQVGQGVYNGTVVPQNPFASYNRIHFERCGDAASTALEMVPVVNGVPQEQAAAYPDLPVMTRVSEVPAFHYGRDTWRGLFHGLATPAGRDLDGDGVSDLPDLSDAEMVLLVGGSDASVWLVYVADALASELRDIAGESVDVRLFIDGFFEPSLDNEGRYHPEAPDEFDMFRHPYGVTGLCALPEGEDPSMGRTCSDANYLPDGALGNFRRREQDIRGVVRDESCEDMHGEGSAPCADKLHTLLHHVAIPFLVIADQEDMTITGLSPPYADDPRYHWTIPAYRRRVLDQAHDAARYWSTEEREEGAGTEGNAALVILKARRDGQGLNQATHVRAGSDERMQYEMTRCSADLQELASATLAELVELWLTRPLPASAIIEDGAAWDGSSPFWVSGGSCRQPE